MSKRTNIQDWARKQLKRLRSKHGQAFASGDVEAIHQLRVASRRLEEPLAICHGWAKDKEIDRLVRRLKRIRRAFAEVRELDVLQVSLAKAGDDGLELTVREALSAQLAAERVKQLHKARGKCSRSKLDKLESGVHAIFEQIGEVETCSTDWYRPGLRELIDERAVRVLAHGVAGNPDDGGTESATGNTTDHTTDSEHIDLHQIRVGLKKLRYAVELRAAVEEADKSPIEQFKRMQDLLGDWNDHLQAAQRISGMARGRRTLVARPEHSAALLDYAARRARRAGEMAEQFLGGWADFQKVIRCLTSGLPNNMCSEKETPNESSSHQDAGHD